jgi:glutaminyl-tRNA synthetase
MSYLENTVREHLNRTAQRRMAVLDPLKVVIDNYPEDNNDELDAVNNPNDDSAGSRKVSFAREIYIERADFMEDPPKKFFRLGPGREVRLRYAYLVTCTDVEKNDAGEVIELRCTYDPESRGGNAPDGRKVKGTIHWVSAEHAVSAEVRLYDHLFAAAEPGLGDDWLDGLNPHSLEVRKDCLFEPSLADLPAGETVQFERLGYFCRDADATADNLIFNRTVSLRDTWAKQKAKG